jgi:hypothetical protein
MVFYAHQSRLMSLRVVGTNNVLVLHQGYFDGALVGWGEFANPNTMTAQFVGVPTVTPTYGTVSAHGCEACLAYMDVGKVRGHYGLLSSRGIITSLCKSRTR